MFTIMKPLAESMFRGQFWLTSSLEQWTQFDLDLMVKSSGQITLSLANLELEITGPRVITLKASIEV
jgi:hypothetical protein